MKRILTLKKPYDEQGLQDIFERRGLRGYYAKEWIRDFDEVEALGYIPDSWCFDQDSDKTSRFMPLWIEICLLTDRIKCVEIMLAHAGFDDSGLTFRERLAAFQLTGGIKDDH